MRHSKAMGARQQQHHTACRLQVAWTPQNTVLYPAICSLAGLVAGAVAHSADRHAPCLMGAAACCISGSSPAIDLMHNIRMPEALLWSAWRDDRMIDVGRHVWRGRRHREGAADAGDGGAARRGGGHLSHHDHVRRRPLMLIICICALPRFAHVFPMRRGTILCMLLPLAGSQPRQHLQCTSALAL